MKPPREFYTLLEAFEESSERLGLDGRRWH
jgi:hypothetical protein